MAGDKEENENGNGVRARNGVKQPAQDVNHDKPDQQKKEHLESEVRKIQQKHSLHLWLLFFNRLSSAIMRMAMGPLVVYICEDVSGCAVSSKGQLMSAFSLGYVATQIPGGALADRVGCREVIFFATLGAGICTCLTPDAAMLGGVKGMVAIQVLMGALQGPLFPASIGFMAGWLPADQRTWASTLLDTGITMGSLIALPMSGRLVSYLGWQGVFRFYGILVIVYSGVWYSFAERIEDLQLDRSRASNGHAAEKPKAAVPWSVLMKPAILAIFFSHAVFNFGTYFLTSWPPTYYADVLGVRPEDAVFDFMLPPLVNLAVNCVNTRLFARARHHCSQTQCRKLFTALGFGFSSGLYLIANVARGTAFSRPLTTLCFSLANGCVGLQSCGFKANYMEAVSVRNAGVVSGFGNTVASAAAFLGPLWVAYVLEATKSWNLVFMSVAVLQVAAPLVYGMFASTECQDASIDDDKKTS